MKATIFFGELCIPYPRELLHSLFLLFLLLLLPSFSHHRRGLYRVVNRPTALLRRLYFYFYFLYLLMLQFNFIVLYLRNYRNSPYLILTPPFDIITFLSQVTLILPKLVSWASELRFTNRKFLHAPRHKLQMGNFVLYIFDIVFTS